ncbi:MAG: ABC-F type ribosomal protection protein [Bacillaceae bacterium]|jgi:ATP-binding cassette subfamily F protein 3|uniref:ABC-F family ATP-binding cassette domain-containing protein n=1 Tax=Aeribacillus composti TaxID=1868734 RepID=A0ABY9WBI3_9BACI|nr:MULTISPECIES: ABC-F family ATP-binding cassette domain-containing protein [Aeribacillus]REJ12294.1 MAG: ABC-F type ribosomal protection protein [Bacillaceae bacterium]KZM55982.1 multidrug ABC transporter ATP-binding protein [Aeribacillus pallidus]MED0650834.1 ABC-F family ATP-binding cassette domain-containing protein [Aeribacillus composti]MED0703090.1 ABC-F family ATP-binding cassette domain-containing protein [Aeribacillus composti]MED1437221.1 ABC-F family ATP-binding cassette domain-co
MILLQLNKITKYYGADLILSNIKLEIQTGDKIAVVGRNGAGKSTLLKIIAGEMPFDSGEIVKPKDLTIGYLAQNTGLESTKSIWDEMLTVFEELRNIEAELRNIEQKMAAISSAGDSHALQSLMKEYDSLQHLYKENGGYQYEADIRSVLHGLGFADYDYSTKISVLSGGQKTRLALGKLLLKKPDLLILDEPTNHLDMETLNWLEQYLQHYNGAVLIVSHDRYFLDRVVNTVYEISRTVCTKYVGNYSAYLKQKAEAYERELKQFEKQQEEIARMKDFIQRNLARASTTKRAQSRRKMLEKMEILDRPAGDEKSASFSFEIEKQSGNDVLKAIDLSLSYDQKTPIVKNINFSINRKDSIALIGPNGVGKSTLLKTIINRLKPLSGKIQFGSNVQIGYYDQEQADLSSSKRVLDELWDDYPEKTEKEIRTVLGNFLFSGDEVLKTVSSLSGGEKARLALAKLMLKKANFLIMDEPTNHLDLDSKEVLENALINFPGTILFVSHDRYFINKIATKIFELSTEGIAEYIGDYDYYIAKKAEMIELEQLKEPTIETKEQKQGKLSYEQEKILKKKERQRQRRIEELENKIAEIEEAIAENNEMLCDPNIYQDHEKAQKLHDQNVMLTEQLDQLIEEWESLLSE